MSETSSATIVAEMPDARDLGLHFVFTTYGVAVRIESNDDRVLAKAKAIAKKAFLDRLEFIIDDNRSVDIIFGIAVIEGGAFQLRENRENISETPSEAILMNFFRSYLRVSVAERSKDWIFVHAGVVGYNGRAIVIPGNSFSGKTTLVAELVKFGAEYMSDEYAIFDSDGMVYPFQRDLSIRVNGDRRNAVETKLEALGGRAAMSALPVGLVICTEYVPGESWAPVRLSLGNGIKEMIPHTISIRLNTSLALKALNTGLSRAIILKGARPESGPVAKEILSLADSDSNWS
ncbi:MAG: hypothetical protein ABI791_04005 [Acidobacteriota bacterium]